MNSQAIGGPGQAGQAFMKAERLFRSDPHWLGSDATLSVTLAPDRILWLFGDTFLSRAGLPEQSLDEITRNFARLCWPRAVCVRIEP